MVLAASTQAPQPPGGLGQRVEPTHLRSYLIAMDGWLEARKGELDAIDEVAQNAAHADELTPDIRLSMSLWQSIQNRYVQLLRVWDAGRVGPKEQEQLSALIWGRLDDDAPQSAAKGLSLPEACKLSDALTGQLRMRLQLDPTGSESLGRLRNLRASMERLRDQIALEPAQTRGAAEAHFQQLADRVEDLAERASRGGDIGGMLGPLENESAKFERDLIVNGALRREGDSQPTQPAVAATSPHPRNTADAAPRPVPAAQPTIAKPVEDTSAAVEQLSSSPLLAPPGEDPHHFAARARTELLARGAALTALIENSPSAGQSLTVPDVTVLGPVPQDQAALGQYIHRLQRVDQAMDYVEERCKALLPPHELADNLIDLTAEQLPADEVIVALLDAARLVAERPAAPAEIFEDLLRLAHQYAATLPDDTESAPPDAVATSSDEVAAKDDGEGSEGE